MRDLSGRAAHESRRPPQEIIKDLEEQRAKTKWLGTRNALRMIPRDLYRVTNRPEKVLEQLRAMLAENDAALQAKSASKSFSGVGLAAPPSSVVEWLLSV